MRKTPAIAGRDFAAYFHSPAGFLVATLFLALQGLVMWMFVRFLGRPDAPPGAVMEFFFGGTILYWIAVVLLAAVVPMRLVSEELRTGTIEPLLTAPVTAGDVVLGKWLAAVAFYVALWAPTLLYLVFLRSADAHLDPGPIAAGYLGTVLVGAAVLAVGLWASSLTRNQLVAGTLSFVAVFVLLLLGALESQVADPGRAELLRRASLFRIMEDFGHGIVDSRHVLALVTLAVLALYGTWWQVERLRDPAAGLRGLVRGAPAALSTVLVLSIALMANYLGGRHYLRGDWTRAGVYSVSDKTIEVLRSLPRRVDVHAFLYPGGQGEEGRAVSAMVRELLERFRRFAPDRLAVEIVDPDRSPQRAEAMQKKYDVANVELAQGVVVFASGDRSKFVTGDDLVEYDYGSGGGDRRLKAWKGEAAFLGAVLTVTEDEPVTVCFTKGHGEPDIESFDDGGYAAIAEELRREAEKTRAVERIGASGVPGDCRVLVVAEPQQAFDPPELAALDRYLENGGRLFLLVGPVFNRDASGFARVGIEDLAARWGARLGDALVVDPEHASDLEGPSVWAAAEGNYGEHPVAKRMRDRVTFWPRARPVVALPSQSLDASVLVHSSDKGWGETSMPTIRGEIDLKLDASADVKGPVPVAVAVEAPAKKARLAVFGTGRLVMSYRLGGLLVRDYNRDLFVSTVAWLANKPQRVGVGPKTPEHVKLTLDASAVSRVFWVFVVGLPLSALALAGLVWRRRRV